MTIRDLLAQRRPTLSYELFPPRTPAAESSLADTMRLLAATAPDFMSITYGASGTTRTTSRGVVQRLAELHTIPPLAHLTCVDQSRVELTQVIEEYLGEGVRDFLALRGDPPKGQVDWRPHPDGLVYAADLVTLLREVAAAHGVHDLSIGVTAFPAQHADPSLRELGLDVLRAKQDAGADFAITQVFYDAEAYLGLVAGARRAGVTIPIVPGIIPPTDPARLLRTQELTGVPVPPELLALLAAADDEAERHRRGIAYAVDLVNGVLDGGAPGIHLYTFNRHEAALDLLEGADLLVRPSTAVAPAT